MTLLILLLIAAALTIAGLVRALVRSARATHAARTDNEVLHDTIEDLEDEVEDLKAKHREDEDTMVARHADAMHVKDQQISVLQQQGLQAATLMREGSLEISRLREEILLVRQRELPVLADIRAGIEGATTVE